MGIQQYFCATSFRNLCACMQTVMSLQGMLEVIGILCCKHLMMVAIATPYKFQPEYIAHKLSCCCLKIHIHCAGTYPGGCPTFGYSHTCNIAHHKQGQIEKIDRGGGGGHCLQYPFIHKVQLLPSSEICGEETPADVHL